MKIRPNSLKYTTKLNRILTIILALAMVICLAGVIAFRIYLSNKNKGQTGEIYDRYYVMIADDRKSSFSQSVYQNAFSIAKENGIYLDLFGEYFTTDFTKEELLRMAIAADVDGIILEADESPSLAELIEEAYLAEIPVVTLMNDSTQSRRVSFVGVGGYNVGKEYGQQVLSIINSQKRKAALENDGGDRRANVNVSVLINSVNENSGQNIIFSGIQDAVSQGNVNGDIINISILQVDNTNTFSVEESIRDLFMNQDIPNIIICLDELTTTCVYQAVVDYNVVGDVSVLGYFDSEPILNAIKRGTIHSTVGVNTEELGEYCIEALMDYNEYGTTSQYYTAGITLITQNNVADYLAEETADD